VLTHIKYFSELSGAKMTSHEIDAYLEKFEILRYKNFKLKDLSKGNAQKLQLALCFLGNPDLLILDEPFSGLDPLNRKVLSKILYEGSHERYIIFSSHQMTEIEQFCSDILILKKGEIKYFGGINELKELYQSKKIVEIIYRNSSNEIVREKTVSESNVLHWLKTNSTLDILNFSYGVPSLEEIYLEIMKE
jgi:ABC-2 type transport system ATP-binding protein